jgi:hypothetical protein
MNGGLSKIHYEQYLKLSEWTKLEAVCLLSGIDPAYYLEQLPRIFHSSPLSGFYPCPPRIEELQRFMRAVNKEIDELFGIDDSLCYPPKDLIGWAISKGFEIPDDLKRFAPAIKKPRVNGYIDRNADFKLWKDEHKSDLEKLTKKEIHGLLIKRNPTLWISGFTEWWKQSGLKKEPGRKKVA